MNQIKIKSVLIMLMIDLISSLWINFTISHQVLSQTPEQISQLKEAEVPVILPTYIPQGFRLIDFQSNVDDERVKVSKDSGCCPPGCLRTDTEKHKFCWDYRATYKGPNNSSFIVLGTNLPIGDAPTLIRQWLLNTDNFGEVTLSEVTFGNPDSSLYAVIRSNSDRAIYFFESPDPDFSNNNSNSSNSSNSISPQEASKIIRSWQFKYP